MADRPVVSVVIPTYNAVRYVEAAVRSALAQTLAEIEVVLVDDCSTDSTLAVLQAIQTGDSRVRVERLARNGGPGAARNRAMALARGRYAAVLDSDDLMAPDRLARLVSIAEREGADIVADNLVMFDSDQLASASFFLDPMTKPGWIGADHYLRHTVMYESKADLGYLKPLFRLETLRASGIGYDEQLRIAEDDNLIARLLLAGKRYWLEPSPDYAYRRHAGSISHRLTVAACAAMAQANAGLLAAVDPAWPADVRQGLAHRQRALEAALSFERLIAALKAGRPLEAVSIALACPACVPLLRMPIGSRWARLTGRSATERPADEAAVAALHRIIEPMA